MMTEIKKTTPSSVEPIRVVETELSAQIPPIEAAQGGRTYARALVLVRLHGQPVGLVELEIGGEALSSAEVAAKIWKAVAEPARAHLQRDGLPVPVELPADGWRSQAVPPCIEERNRLLEDAPLASVIVATHERPSQLKRCVDSLLGLHYPSFEIIVVDSGPASPRTHDLVVRHYSKEVQYIRVDRPGLAVAHNVGLGAAKGSILAFIDDDVVADRLWLASLVVGFAAEDDVACTTGLILPLELETIAQRWVVAHSRLSKGFDRQVFDLDRNRPAQPLYPYTAGTFGSGTNMAFTASFLNEVGGFDPALGVGTVTRGGDDLAAFFEVVQRGHVLVYEPSAIVWHDYRSDDASLPRHFFSYGMGLSAFLTKTIVDRPGRLVNLTLLLPRGIAHMLRIRSSESLVGLPRHFIRREWAGMLFGPLAYFVSRYRSGRQRPVPPRRS